MKILRNKDYIELINYKTLYEQLKTSQELESKILNRNIAELRAEIKIKDNSINGYREQEEYFLHFIGKNTKINKKTAELAVKFDLFEEECQNYFGKIRGARLYFLKSKELRKRGE